MPENPFANQSAGMTAPLTQVFAITPGAPLEFVTRAIMVGSTGTVNITTLGGRTITTLPLAAGIWHPIMCSAVGTGGTATQIHGGC